MTPGLASHHPACPGHPASQVLARKNLIYSWVLCAVGKATDFWNLTTERASRSPIPPPIPGPEVSGKVEPLQRQGSPIPRGEPVPPWRVLSTRRLLTPRRLVLAYRNRDFPKTEDQSLLSCLHPVLRVLESMGICEWLHRGSRRSRPACQHSSGSLYAPPPPPAEAQTGEKHPGSCREEKVSGVGSSASPGAAGRH